MHYCSNALGQKEAVWTCPAVVVGSVFPLEALVGFTGMCSQLQVPLSLELVASEVDGYKL